jgi:TonB-linked SusC/RagA family outer membrane protein
MILSKICSLKTKIKPKFMKRFLLLLTVLSLSIAWQASYAQTRILTGTVKDDKGLPIIGATVEVKGTTVGTVTDIDGNYSLAAPQSATELEIKYVGLKTEDIALGTDNVVNVSMQNDVLGLDEVVVTALGVSKTQKSLGYDAQTVGSDQINKSGTGNALNELDGKVSGLTVVNSAGTPGSGTYLQLRGPTSLLGSNQPLIIVDGIPMDNSVNGFDAVNNTTASLGGVQNANRGIDIDPNDIASITVLKGPSATALYGIHASSGAIVITTKKGSKTGPHLTINSSSSIDQVNKFPDEQNMFGQGSNGAILGPSSHSSFSWGPNIDTIAWDGVHTTDPSTNGYYDSHGAIVSKNSPDAKIPFSPYDNEKNFFVNGFTLDNDVAFSGGNDNSGYRLAVSNLHQNGVVPLTKYVKSNVTLSGQTNLSKEWSTSAAISYINSTNNEAQQGSNTSGIMLGLLRTPITFDNSNGVSDPANDSVAYEFPDGNPRNYRGEDAGYDNPYWSINHNPYTTELNRVYGFGQVDFKPLNWLSFTYRLGTDLYEQDNKQAIDIQSDAEKGSGLVYLNNFFNRQFNSDFIVNLQKDFNKNWSGSLLLGQNYFTQYGKSVFTEGTGLTIPGFYDISNASSVVSSEGEGRYRTMAWYGEGTLSYKDMLYLTLTGRDETSSTLPANNDVFFYPSASLGFVFTDALGLSNNNTFPYGKLRLSYAQVGHDAPQEALQTYYGTNAVADGFTPGDQFPFNGFAGYSIAGGTVGNPILQPENTNSFEGGLDLAFFQNRISLNATYFNEKSENEILTVPISNATGWGSAVLNAGTITNNGIELTLNVTPLKLKNGFTWDVTLNWSKYNNDVSKLYPGVTNIGLSGFQNGATYIVAGLSYGQIYGSDYVRTSSGQLLINDNPADPGYLKPIAGATDTVLGSTQPDWIGSAVTNFSFKGFTLSVQLNIKQGGDVWDGTRGALAYFGRAEETATRGQSQVFQGDLGHQNASGQIVHYASDGVTEVAGAGAANTTSSVLDQYYWQNIGSSFIGPTKPDVEDGSFVRISQISLTYDLAKSVLKDKKLYSAAITIFANNPFLWTNYTGVDPETSLVGPVNGQGLDYFNMPGIKSYGIRLSLGL